MGTKTERFIALAERHGAHNYHPLPVVISKAKGPFVWDCEGRRYFDFLSAYSALNQGHNHPAIVAAARAQLGKVALTSRAFHNERLGPLLKRLCELTGQDKAILMNSGAEAVETAVKAMRLWGYRHKGVPEGQAEILVCEHNFHGRTTTIVGFSSDPDSYNGFGPATPGFRKIPFGDAKALEAAIGPNTVGFLFEPIQGEAGVLVPPEGWLAAVRQICSEKRVLMCADEIQTGLGRTGKMFACDHEGVKPDLVILGKALSGGLYPVSAVCADDEVMDLFTPGTHGSTYGGNPLACAIAEAALTVIEEEHLVERAARVGALMKECLESLEHPKLKAVRGKGLMLGVEFSARVRPMVEDLMRRGLLAKDTHETTIRFAPPLILTESQAADALKLIRAAVAAFPA
jgi:ornithine--oxo-acid transaminase